MRHKFTPEETKRGSDAGKLSLAAKREADPEWAARELARMRRMGKASAALRSRGNGLPEPGSAGEEPEPVDSGQVGDYTEATNH